MAFDKTVDAVMWSVTGQNSDVRLTTGTSAGGTFTAKPNPLRGTMMWDRACFVVRDITVTGGATGGSYNIWLETDVVPGYKSLPIGFLTIGPNSPKSAILANLHHTASSPMATKIFIDQTATGGTASFTIDVLAKQYRGVLGSPGSKTSERVITGTLLRGTSTGGVFGDDAGLGATTTTFTLGTSGSTLGMHRLRLWDAAYYWVTCGSSVSGTHDVDIIATTGGATHSVAYTSAAGGAVNVAGESVTVVNQHYGLSPNPTHIIWTQVTAGGVSDARVVVLAKSGRGSLAKQ